MLDDTIHSTSFLLNSNKTVSNIKFDDLSTYAS